ncbi:hypothetical protein GH5_01327 [Leishmania sp. Ghana 2012 LV757]|uniref:hypothetical protein n=1 Tax=Leishmania sp. Ghana 2012 LV757 TaxID=2803181 RepID=UPI001B73E783|nr:hypothetical protein GH5_01327 [Leishmania sp. Ghana 2012 LV757]
MPLPLDSSVALFVVALLIAHIVIVGGLFVLLWSQSPKKRVRVAMSVEERATIRRHVRKDE